MKDAAFARDASNVYRTREYIVFMRRYAQNAMEIDDAEAHDWFEELLKLDKAYKNNASMAVLWIAAALLGDPICREIVKHNSNYLETLNNLMGDEVSFEKSMKILKWQDGKKIAV